jgi:putative salt-induced outer membrane protein YdiY
MLINPVRKILFSLTALIILCVQALADQITFKNGDRLTGKIVKSAGPKLLIKTELTGDVTVDLSAVTNITTDQPLYLTLADGKTVSGTLVVSGENAELRAKDSTVTTIKRSSIQIIRSEADQLAYEKSLHPGWLQNWSGGADFGLALTSGNSETTNIALGAALTRATLRDKTSIYAASVYNRDDTGDESRTIANTIRGGVRYDHDITKKLFGYGFVDLEHNGLQDLTLRLVLGGGLGYHAIRNERTLLDLLGGLDWNKEYFRGDLEDRSSMEAQVGQTLSHRFTARFLIKEQLFVFPNLTNGGEFRVNFDTSLVTEITRRIGWQLTVSDRYLSNPPEGFKKNDLLLTTGINVKLGELR